jgi:hypothetical protein
MPSDFVVCPVVRDIQPMQVLFHRPGRKDEFFRAGIFPVGLEQPLQPTPTGTEDMLASCYFALIGRLA